MHRKVVRIELLLDACPTVQHPTLRSGCAFDFLETRGLEFPYFPDNYWPRLPDCHVHKIL